MGSVFKKNIFILFCLLLLVPLLPATQACKDVIAVNDATAGSYNLLMKVRDPSRPGLQVALIVPKDYTYTYHHPVNGNNLPQTVDHKFIGICTKGDTPPNIIKPGMVLTQTGLAFGDADTNSNWVNVRRFAWDDFDWIRYSCQQAENEDEAVRLLTEKAVDQLHAPGVSENLFVVGPTKAMVVEADAWRYTVTEVDNIWVMSNYPKDLWKTQRHNKAPLARSFDTEKTKTVRAGQTIRLGSLFGVQVIRVNDDSVVVRMRPPLRILYRSLIFMGSPVEIRQGERQTVGQYSVTAEEISANTATLHICYEYKAWEDLLYSIINQKRGEITVADMMNWSRLLKSDLDGLRGMCEEQYPYEAVTICQVPHQHEEQLSCLWFSANHACSSIYVPIHIADDDILQPYQSGKAAELSLDLLNSYDPKYLSSVFSTVETVFIEETQNIENLLLTDIKNTAHVQEILTLSDVQMQQQAMLTQHLWYSIKDSEELQQQLSMLWNTNYSETLHSLRNLLFNTHTTSSLYPSKEMLVDIAVSICNARVQIAHQYGYQETSPSDLQHAKHCCLNGRTKEGFNSLQNIFNTTTAYLFHEVNSTPLKSNYSQNVDENTILIITSIVATILFITVGVYIRNLKNKQR